MVCGCLLVPAIDEVAGADRKTVAAIGVSYLQDWPRHGLSLSKQQLESMIFGLRDREKCDRSGLDAHLNRKTAANLTVIDLKRTQLGFALGDACVPRSIMSHEDDVIDEVDRIVLGEGATGAEAIHDLHSQRVLDLILAGHRNAATGEQRRAEDDGGDSFFILLDAGTFVEVGERSKRMELDELL